MVSGYNGTSANVVIGQTRYDKPVKAIGFGAFQNNQTIESIYIPKNIETMGTFVFENCTNLRQVIFENGSLIEQFGQSTFKGCTNLRNIDNIPENLTYIGLYAFEDCSKLQLNTHNSSQYFGDENNPYLILMSQSPSDAYIHSNTRFIYSYSLKYSEKTLEIPKNVVQICSYANASASLEHITFENNSLLTVIGASAFANGNIKSIELPKALNMIEEEAFANCRQLEIVKFANNGTSLIISDRSFINCISLKNIYLPEYISKVSASIQASNSPFYGCSIDLVIYCECLERPSDWSSFWNYYAAYKPLSVVWGYTHSQYLEEISQA